MHQNILKLEDAALLIVDVQEAFRQSIPDFADVARQIAVFVRGIKLLSVPIIVTEQYPRGLGHTAAEITAVLPTDFDLVEKTAFSAGGSLSFAEKLKMLDRRQIIVAGIEAHICVNQTVHDLLAQNYQVHLLVDGISSRLAASKQVALAKMQQSGAICASVEMALFEIMRDSRHGNFKAIQRLIR